jgi:hypothetical protein
MNLYTPQFVVRSDLVKLTTPNIAQYFTAVNPVSHFSDSGLDVEMSDNPLYT